MLCFIVSYRGVQFVQTPVCTYVPKFLEVDIQQLKDLLNWVFMTFCLLLKCSNYLSLSEMIFSDKFIELYALLMILIALMFELSTSWRFYLSLIMFVIDDCSARCVCKHLCVPHRRWSAGSMLRRSTQNLIYILVFLILKTELMGDRMWRPLNTTEIFLKLYLYYSFFVC